MYSALLYLQWQTVKNQMLARVRRLKQPKYLAGLVVGGLYLYFYFFRYLLRRGQPGFVLNLSAGDRLLLEFAGATILFVIVFLAWVIPHQRAALTFTEAEIAFLFPAPISRRMLIHFKLLRSQTAILFTTLLLTIVTNRFGGKAWIQAAGWWLILSALNLHFLGSSFAMTKLADRGITKWRRRGIILALVLMAAGAVLIWARRTLPPFDLDKYADLDRLKVYLREVLISGPVPYLLYPFRLVVRPFLAPDPWAFVVAVPPVLLLILLEYVWVVRADVAFEEASIEASKKLATKVAAVRSGNWSAAQRPPKKRRPPFPLRPTGHPAVALLWKNLISAGQVFTLRIWLRLALVAVIAAMIFGRSAGSGNVRPLVGMIAAMLMFWSLFAGAQIFRQDFRQDLAMADVLKSYPMPAWQLVLGQLLAPAVILTGLQWFLLIILLGFFPFDKMDRAMLYAIAAGAAIVIPVINLITLQIPNAAVLLFPGWFQTGKGVSHGIEVTGQRLIFIFGQFLVFALALVPAAAGFAALYFPVWSFVGVTAGIVAGSIAAAVVLAAEASAGIVLLGWLFRRFDVAAEQTA